MDNNSMLPFEIKDVEENVVSEWTKDFLDRTGLVRAGPKGYILPSEYKARALGIYNMPVRRSDLFILGLPRSGTTLTQELVWLVANNFDFPKANSVDLGSRYVFIENAVNFSPDVMQAIKVESEAKKLWLCEDARSGVEKAAEMTPPRFLKTHLALSLLPPTLLDVGKIVYVARDPRDVVVSYYHYHKMCIKYSFAGDFKKFWNYFIEDMVLCAPYFDHLKEAWARRHHPNMLILFYEELSRDLAGAVRRVARFVDKPCSEEQVERLCTHLHLDNFKSNERVNNSQFVNCLYNSSDFIRKGKVGGWREWFDEEMCAQAEQWIARNLRGSDLTLPTWPTDSAL